MIPRRTCALPVVLLLAGCAAGPSAVVVGAAGESVSVLFNLDAGDYDATWTLDGPSDCFADLSLINNANFDDNLALDLKGSSGRTAIRGLANSDYYIGAAAANCPWTVRFTKR